MVALVARNQGLALGDAWAQEVGLKGDFFTGYSDYPPFTRAVLLHSMPKLGITQLKMTTEYARWIYVTEDPYKPGDHQGRQPWDTLSKYLPILCEELKSLSAIHVQCMNCHQLPPRKATPRACHHCHQPPTSADHG